MYRIIPFSILLSMAAHCNNFGLLDKLENPAGTTGKAECTDDGTGIVKSGLFAWWNLNGTLDDRWDCGAAGQHAAGTAFTYVTDRFGVAGNAISLTPTTGFIHLGTFPEYQMPPFTVCTWIKLVTTASFDAVTNTSAGSGYAINVAGTGTSMATKMNNVGTNSSGAGLNTTVWNYVCLAYDASGHDGYYGQFAGALNSFSGTGTFAPSVVSLDLTGSSFGAQFDDAVFYRRKLTPSEIQRNFTASQQ